MTVHTPLKGDLQKYELFGYLLKFRQAKHNSRLFYKQFGSNKSSTALFVKRVVKNLSLAWTGRGIREAAADTSSPSQLRL